MKKVLLFTMLFLLVAAVPAMAEVTTYGPHGNYTSDTDSCSACHETHDAEGANLFNYAGETVLENCFYCHGGAGLGSVYNTETGKIANTNNASGGALNYKANNGLTSMHNVEQTDVTAGPGSALEAEGAKFTCASCHNPHGTLSDRLLITSRVTLDNSLDSEEGDTEPDYDPITLSVGANKFDIGIANPKANEVITYNAGANAFCGLCHYDYDTTGETDPGDTKNGYYDDTKYRHAVGLNPADLNGDGVANDPAPAYNASHGLPLENSKITCLSCHKAHSTTATATKTYSKGQSALLRLNDRGVCIACHKWQAQ